MIRINLFVRYGAKNFRKAMKKRGSPNNKELGAEYRQRYIEYINAEDWGEGNFRLSSFLNMFLGITCCKISREQGYSFDEAVKIFDDQCLGMRKLAKNMMLAADALPRRIQNSGGYGVNDNE